VKTSLKQLLLEGADTVRTQNRLKTSDGSNAGATDVKNIGDINFNIMRNSINSDGEVSGSDINDYLERAKELNDEVESVGFAIEIDNGDIIKVYVNSEDADSFEEEMSKLLGLEGDFEAAINELAQKYDIVDVVWPDETPEAPDEVDDSEDDLTIDDMAPYGHNGSDDSADDDDIIDIPSADEASSDNKKSEPEESEDIIDVPAQDELDAESDDDKKKKKNSDGADIIDVPRAVKEHVFNFENTLVEDVRDEINAHIAEQLSSGNKGKYFIKTTISGDTLGLRTREYQRDGEIVYFEDLTTAKKEAKRLTNKMNTAGATASYKYDVTLVEDSKSDFIDDDDSIKDGLNIKLDSAQKQLVHILKRPIEKQIIGLFAICNIPGRFLKNNKEVIEKIRDAGDFLRKNKSALSMLDKFYHALATTQGFSIGDNDDESTADLEIKESSLRGTPIQQKLELMLVFLGLPEKYVLSGGTGIISPYLAKAASIIELDPQLHSMLNKLTIKLGISISDFKVTGSNDIEESIIEDVINEFTLAQSSDPFTKDVIALLNALGVPADNLGYKSNMLKMALQKNGQSLNQRPTIQQRIKALTSMLLSNKKPQNNTVQNSNITEAFNELEALTRSEAHEYKIDEPAAGPAHMATYNGGRHDETIMTVGVESKKDGYKTLCVAIYGPHDGTMHSKYFTDDEAGYKDALKYANMLRTVNLKSGGRPKGWKD
jgi:hypothetical protein